MKAPPNSSWGDVAPVVEHGVALKEMDFYPDGSFGCIITDPPYSADTHANQRTGTRRKLVSRASSLGFDALTDEDRDALALEFARLARRWIVVFSDDRGIAGWRNAFDAAGIEWVRTGVWVKLGATPQFTGDRPAQGVEFILIGHAARASGRMRWNGGGRHAVWSYAVARDRQGERRIHTAQKPLELMDALVRDFTDPGESILDPFAGGGTTLVAAKRNGRKGIGFEKKKVYVNAANRRIASTREQRELFQ